MRLPAFGTLALLALANPLPAQIVRGQVADSVTRDPLAGTTVRLLDAVGAIVASTTTDDAGRFLLRGPSPAVYYLQAERAGYAFSDFPPFDLAPEQVASYMLLLSSLSRPRMLGEAVGEVCPDRNPEQPVIGGRVRHVTDSRVAPGALVMVSWSTIPDAIAERVSASDFSTQIRADSTGFYAVCGLPVGRTIWLHAAGDSSLSDFLNVVFRGGEVFINSEAYAGGPVWQQDILIASPDQRSTTLTGTVTDAESGAVMSGATVSLLGTEFTATTDAAGTFAIAQLPSGPVRVRARRVGYQQAEAQLWLPKGGMVELPLALGRGATELDPLVVEAAPPHDPLAEFRVRQESGNGSFITREEFMKSGNPSRATDVMRRMPGIRIRRGVDYSMPWIVTMNRGGPRSFTTLLPDSTTAGSGCPPLYFLDRHPIGNANVVEIDGAIPLEHVEAIEAHASAATLPYEFARPGSDCGVIAFWTRFAKPRSVAVQEPGGSETSFWDSTGFHFLASAAAVTLFFFGLGKRIHF